MSIAAVAAVAVGTLNLPETAAALTVVVALVVGAETRRHRAAVLLSAGTAVLAGLRPPQDRHHQVAAERAMGHPRRLEGRGLVVKSGFGLTAECGKSRKRIIRCKSRATKARSRFGFLVRTI